MRFHMFTCYFRKDATVHPATTNLDSKLADSSVNLVLSSRSQKRMSEVGDKSK